MLACHHNPLSMLPEWRPNRHDVSDERRRAVDADVVRLTGVGATIRTAVDSAEGYWVVMHDPEGNEFCVQ